MVSDETNRKFPTIAKHTRGAGSVSTSKLSCCPEVLVLAVRGRRDARVEQTGARCARALAPAGQATAGREFD